MKSDLDKLPGERHLDIEIEYFDYLITVILSSDADAARAARDNLFCSEWTYTGSEGITLAFGCGATVIFLKHTTSPGTIAHECFHAIWNLYEHIGSKVENEITAHLLGHLTDRVYNFVRKSK